MIKWYESVGPAMQRIEKQANDAALFVRFINHLLNDMIYLVDEALMKAEQLCKLIAEEKSGTLSYPVRIGHCHTRSLARLVLSLLLTASFPLCLFSSLQQRRENQERQNSLARGLRTASVLAVHSVQLLALLAQLPTPLSILLRSVNTRHFNARLPIGMPLLNSLFFSLVPHVCAFRAEILDRLIQFVNQFLTKLLTPTRRVALHSNDFLLRTSCSFKPDEWLATFLAIYVLMSREHSTFVEAMAKEGAGFHSEQFSEAADLVKPHLKPDQHASLVRLIDAATAHSDTSSSRAAELGEVPDEFLDPILQTLMNDPVTLPSSGITVDRATITRHLLNKPSDPFNRAPLTVEQLVPNTELKRRIDEFLREHK